MAPRPARLALAAVLAFAGVSHAEPEPSKADEPPATPAVLEIVLADDSRLRAQVLDEALTLNTPFGRLQFPAKDVAAVEFATRLSEALARQIDQAIVELGDERFKKREAAGLFLKGCREKAYPALQKARKSETLEVSQRAEALAQEVEANVPPERLAVREFDVVTTAHSRVSGRLEVTALKVRTEAFGDLTLKLADAVAMRGSAAPVEQGDAPAAPGSLHDFQNKPGEIGKTFRFKVTGAIQGSLWGTDVYTLDSTLAMAAVHAGAVKNGETRVVKVRILPGQAAYVPSVRHGVTSSAFQNFPGSFSFVR